MCENNSHIVDAGRRHGDALTSAIKRNFLCNQPLELHEQHPGPWHEQPGVEDQMIPWSNYHTKQPKVAPSIWLVVSHKYFPIFSPISCSSMPKRSSSLQLCAQIVVTLVGWWKGYCCKPAISTPRYYPIASCSVHCLFICYLHYLGPEFRPLLLQPYIELAHVSIFLV